jgi:peroxiredoxin
MGARKQPTMLEAGKPAPSFRLSELGGGTITLSDAVRDGPALLAFYKTTCPVCQLTLPFLDRIYRHQAERGLAVYGISQDDPESTADFNHEFGVTFPTLLDREKDGYIASNGFGISHVPSLFVVEKDGAISWALEGFSKKQLEQLAGRVGIALFTSEDVVPEWKAG